MDATEDGSVPYGGFMARYQSRGARLFGVVFTGVWLLYLVAGVADLFHHHYSAGYIAGGMAIILVFSVLYLVVVPSWPWPRRHTHPGLAALAVIAVLGCVFYGSAGLAALWIFMSSACGLLVVNRRWAVRAVLGCIACYVIFSFTTHVGNGTFLGNLLPVVFIGFAMVGLRSRVALTAELARARGEVAQLAANEERLRLARDMHDLTGQSLSMITLKSELAARLIGRLPAGAERDRAMDEVEQVAAVSRQTLRDIREAISGYRRPTLAVEVITARATLASAGIAVKDDPALTLLSGTVDPDVEAALAWCLREAVTNVVRHSGAATCHIGLTRRGKRLLLTVGDDGKGHPGGSTRETATAIQGSGLHGMAERLDAVGGTLRIRPDARPGFSLVATVPWHQDANRDDATPEVVVFDQAGLELRWQDDDHPGAARRGSGDDPRGPGRAAVVRGRHRGGRPGRPRRRGDERRAGRQAGRRAARHRDARHGRAQRRGRAARGRPRRQDHHPYHLRPPRLPAPGDGIGRVGVHREGLARGQARPHHPRRPRRPARHRPGPGRRRARRGREPAHPSREGRARRRREQRRRHPRRDRRRGVPVGRHGQELPVLVHPEDRGPQPRRGRPRRPGPRLAVT